MSEQKGRLESQDGTRMAKLEISGEYILNWPDIVAFLVERHIVLRDIRYVKVETLDVFTPNEESFLHGTTRKEVNAIVVLHNNEKIPMPQMKQLIYINVPEQLRQHFLEHDLAGYNEWKVRGYPPTLE